MAKSWSWVGSTPSEIRASGGPAADPRSLLHVRPEPGEGFVPALRDPIEVAAGLGQALRLRLPHPLAAPPEVADEAGVGEDLEVLGDGLPGQRHSPGQLRDRERLACPEPAHQ